MGLQYILTSISFIILFLINIWWIISSAYFLTIEGLDLITSNVDLSGLEVETAGDNDRALDFLYKAQKLYKKLELLI